MTLIAMSVNAIEIIQPEIPEDFKELVSLHGRNNLFRYHADMQYLIQSEEFYNNYCVKICDENKDEFFDKFGNIEKNNLRLSQSDEVLYKQIKDNIIPVVTRKSYSRPRFGNLYVKGYNLIQKYKVGDIIRKNESYMKIEKIFLEYYNYTYNIIFELKSTLNDSTLRIMYDFKVMKVHTLSNNSLKNIELKKKDMVAKKENFLKEITERVKKTEEVKPFSFGFLNKYRGIERK